MNTCHLRILAADQMFFEGACENLVVPCADGSFGVQAHHSNMISAVTPGELHYRPAEGPDAGREKIAAVSAGLVKVERNDVLVMVDTPSRPEEIDADGIMPMEPVSMDASSERISPNMFSVTSTSNWVGFLISCMAVLSTKISLYVTS